MNAFSLACRTLLVVWGLGLPLLTSSAEAALPAVQFDTPTLVACRDVTTPQFAAVHPGEKLVVVTLRISVLVARGSHEDVQEVLLQISHPDRRMRVVDFSPRTELTSDVVGNVRGSTNEQQSRSLHVELTSGLLSAAANASAKLDAQQQATRQEIYERLPPKVPVVASGTMNQGCGVFFKLRPTSQSLLEGAHEFTIVAVVPGAWRGDWLQVDCLARSQDKFLFGSLQVDSGAQRFLIGLHLEADSDARTIASYLAVLADRFARQGMKSPAAPSVVEALFHAKSQQQAQQAQEQRETAWREALAAVRQLAGRESRQ